jgi:hypothetical protein
VLRGRIVEAEGNGEAEHRDALADHFEPKEFIEAHEIRTGKGMMRSAGACSGG